MAETASAFATLDPSRFGWGSSCRLAPARVLWPNLFSNGSPLIRDPLGGMNSAMNWDAFAAIAEAAGAAAVLVTLVYLARQVRHARIDQQAESLRVNRAERRQFFEMIRDSPFLPAIQCKVEAGEPLNPEEQRRLIAHNSAMWALIYSEWVQMRLGLAGKYGTSVENNIALALMGPGARDWFEQFGRLIYPAAFIADVDRNMRARGSS